MKKKNGKRCFEKTKKRKKARRQVIQQGIVQVGALERQERCQWSLLRKKDKKKKVQGASIRGRPVRSFTRKDWTICERMKRTERSMVLGVNWRLANAKSSMVHEDNTDTAYMDEMDWTESKSTVQANPSSITPATSCFVNSSLSENSELYTCSTKCWLESTLSACSRTCIAARAGWLRRAVLCCACGTVVEISCSTTHARRQHAISLYHSRYVVRMKKRPTKKYIWEKKAFILKQDEKKRKTPLAGKL